MKNNRKLIALLLICSIWTCSVIPVCAKTKTVTKTHYVIDQRSFIKALDVFSMYAKDSFKIKYTGKKVITCTPKQSKKDLGSGMFKKGGIKCIKKTNNKWTYQSVWKLNLRLMPKKMQVIAKKFTPYLYAIQKIGTIVKITTTYEVKANGSLKTAKRTLKWFTSIKKYINAVKKILKL